MLLYEDSGSQEVYYFFLNVSKCKSSLTPFSYRCATLSCILLRAFSRWMDASRSRSLLLKTSQCPPHRSLKVPVKYTSVFFNI